MQNNFTNKTLNLTHGALGTYRMWPPRMHSGWLTPFCMIMMIMMTLLAMARPVYAAADGSQLDHIQVTLSMDHEPLVKLFQKIESQTGLRFAYSAEVVSRYKEVTLSEKKRTVKATLDLAFAGLPLGYEANGKNVLVFVKEKAEEQETSEALESFYDPAKAEPAKKDVVVFTVRGTITESVSGEPMPGVNVLVKNTSRGTTTDSEGKYVLDVESDDVLVFSFIGYETQEVPVNAMKVIDVGLVVSSQTLEEVTINAGYYETTERLKTGSIVKVTAEDIENQPVTNVLSALQGRVPGLEVVQASALPGSAFTVRIRGQNSLRTLNNTGGAAIGMDGNLPLFIIDGVPFPSSTIGQLSSIGSSSIYNSNPLNSINPSDIESIEILKDADATAIYGSRGSNGVILIKTKRAETGKIKVGINSSFRQSKVTKKLNLLNTSEYLTMRSEAVKNDGYESLLNPSFSWLFPDILLWDTTRYTNWQEYFLGNVSNTSNTHVSFSGGDKNIQFLFTGDYYSERAILDGDFIFQRGSGHFNFNYASTNDRLQIGFSNTYTLSKNKLPYENVFSLVFLPPNAPEIYDEEGELNWALNTNGTPTWENPMASFMRPYEVKSLSSVGNANIFYSISSKLNFKCNVGYSSLVYDEEEKRPASTRPPTENINVVNLAKNYETTLSIEPQIIFKSRLLKGNFTAQIGGSIQTTNREGQRIKASGFLAASQMDNLSAASLVNVSSTSSQYKYAAVFSRINYNVENKYIINLTARRDGSSRFGPGRRLGNFGAIGVAWVFSEEGFSKNNLGFLNFGKIRSSYGVTGSDLIGDYGYLDSYRSTVDYQIPGLHPSRLANPDYSWEENRKLEVAMELGILNNRIQLSANWFRNRSSSQLVGTPLPDISGFPVVQANFPATVQNTGLEFVVNTKVLSRRSFSLSSYFNVTIPKNKLLSFPNIEQTSYSNLVIGKSLNVLKGYVYEGVDPETGRYTFLDINEDGVLNNLDRKVFNKLQPLYGGIGAITTYKGLSLDVFFQFARMSDITTPYYLKPGRQTNQMRSVMSRWRDKSDLSTVQKFSTEYSNSTESSFNRWIYSTANFNEDKSFIRLKTVSILWRFPKKIKEKIGVHDAQLYCAGQNLLTFTSYKGFDPETETPVLRSVEIGFRITL